VTFISAPTVVEPAGNAAAAAVMAAFSISATIEGVANTGRSPDPHRGGRIFVRYRSAALSRQSFFEHNIVLAYDV